MERQVNALMERMGHVLGPNWGQQLEGRQLRKAGDELLAKLDARSFFRGWVQEWEKELASVTTTRLQSFPVIVEPDARGGQIVAKVNFDEKSELLFKEIRHLKWLGYGKDIPKTLGIVSDEAVARYPFAVTIKTALRSYQAVRVLITSELEPLVSFFGVSFGLFLLSFLMTGCWSRYPRSCHNLSKSANALPRRLM
jgi:dynein heavy chain 1, cytosolic